MDLHGKPQTVRQLQLTREYAALKGLIRIGIVIVQPDFAYCNAIFVRGDFRNFFKVAFTVIFKNARRKAAHIIGFCKTAAEFACFDVYSDDYKLFDLRLCEDGKKGG